MDKQPCVMCGTPTAATITIRDKWTPTHGLRRLPEPLIEPLCPAQGKQQCRQRYVTDRHVRARHAALFQHATVVTGSN